MISFTEENYLKAIYKLMEKGEAEVSTNSIAEQMHTKAATVTDMLKKLYAKKLINYTPYQGASLSLTGRKTALNIIRKHRLWEFFLVEKLKFRWDEVHEMAEELEHIQSAELVERLDQYLNFPKHDPHGDPIPDSKGRLPESVSALLQSAQKGKKYTMTGVVDHHVLFLKHLDEIGLKPGCTLFVENVVSYDLSLYVRINGGGSHYISNQIARNILITSAK
ncbi:MAG TPA: metal-dependent transcriptional regulator [Bacteroidia bacterium]|jgi:DtxR family Mn-dependent transcriptional regulator|nr:metal-dependent transcriptional regulator [Bacteroidia bacterium]